MALFIGPIRGLLAFRLLGYFCEAVLAAILPELTALFGLPA